MKNISIINLDEDPRNADWLHQEKRRKEAKMTKKTEEKEFILNTPGGYPLDEVRSSIQKALRIGDEESAAYWALEFIEGGYWRYLLKTCQCIAVEDIGLGDPLAIVVTTAVKEAIQFKMEKKGLVPTEMIGFVILYLARAPKNREGDDFIEYIQARRKQGWKLEVPEVALDQHCSRGRERLRREGINPNEEFYNRGSKLKNEVILEGNKYRKRILEIYGLKEER